MTQSSGSPAPEGSNRVAMVVLVALLSMVAVTGAVLVVGLGPDGVVALFGSDGGRELGNESKSVTMPASLVVGGDVVAGSAATVAFHAPEGTRSVTFVLFWGLGLSPVSSPLEIRLEHKVGDTWTHLATTQGQNIAILSVAGEFSDSDLRLRVQPAEDGAHPSQTFDVSASYWSESE